MAETTSFWSQANALCRKNLIYQKRRGWENCRLVTYPLLLCTLLMLIQGLVDRYMNETNGDAYKSCGCYCAYNSLKGCSGKKVCGLRFSNMDSSNNCRIPRPQHWPPLLSIPSSDPVTTRLTGNNQSFAESLGNNMFTNSYDVNFPSVLERLANVVMATVGNSDDDNPLFFDDAFDTDDLHYLQSDCKLSPDFNFSFPDHQNAFHREVQCVEAQNLWRNSSSQINEEVFNRKGKVKINDLFAVYDFLNSNENNFNVSIWSIQHDDKGIESSVNEKRIARSVNLVSNAYLQYLRGFGTKTLFEFVKEMPKEASISYVDVMSLLGVFFFTLVIMRLFLVTFISLVYEKQQKVRIMMKMHGLGDGPYWLISYAYFLAVSFLYMLVFAGFGAATGLKIFLRNDFSVQFVFYFLYINLQVSMGFLLATFFSSVKTATVVGYLFVYGSGLLAAFLFQDLLGNPSFPKSLILVLQIYPGFSLFRGLYDLSKYSVRGFDLRIRGMQWGNLSDKENGMKGVLIIMFIEWLVALVVGYYLDQVLSYGKSPLFFLPNIGKKHPSSFKRSNLQRQVSKVLISMDKPDIGEEREKVEQLLLEPRMTHAVICDNLKKVYPGRDGNPDKMAVRGLYLALPQGECFGMLGPNGAGKTSFISMMVGLTKQTSGTAYVEGLDIQTQMDRIHTCIGVCPQHDLLWETLTGREHLLFYGRLKNLKGSALNQAVEKSLRSVKLHEGAVADKQAGKYSGGMKRRLSVAISLIGDPKVVYMDEPSSGLDPAARRNLWNVVKQAKQDRAIVLTTHSMEEADALCDRLGIFVDGSFQCIGKPKELKARFGGTYLFTVTTSPDNEQQVLNMVRQLFPGAERVYYTCGTQKFEIPKCHVRIADVFQAVEIAKNRFPIFAWGLSDTTLEDVFIKVASNAN